MVLISLDMNINIVLVLYTASNTSWNGFFFVRFFQSSAFEGRRKSFSQLPRWKSRLLYLGLNDSQMVVICLCTGRAVQQPRPPCLRALER